MSINRQREMLKYLRISGPGTLPDLTTLRPFKAVIAIEESVSRKRQMEVSKWLVQAGCLYMMAWGIDCSSCDDSVDHANLEAHSFGNIPDNELVMTTWHDDETLKEMMTFAKYTACHPEVDLHNVVVVHMGTIDKGSEFSSMYSAA